jgi:hypothetical protein
MTGSPLFDTYTESFEKIWTDARPLDTASEL